MRDYHQENLSHDPIHGYIPFTSSARLASGETSERQIIDHPWVQRMRHIHQLQTAWWVYPTAEHTRFQHVLGVMHLASRAISLLYPTLKETCPDVPSRGYVETLLRMTGLLHDVGHGPYGHFFDEHFLRPFGQTHETVGAKIVVERLGPLLKQLRRNPNSALQADETLDPQQIAWLMVRPKGDAADQAMPRWLRFLRSLLSGIYTIDNMDFVLRDAFMSGYSQQAFDIDRLLHYTFFSSQGLTLHDKGVDALVRFINVRGELFRNIYFHRTVRAIDLALQELFIDSRNRLFPGDPTKHLDQYLRFHESSLMVDVDRWADSNDTHLAALGDRWRRLLQREVPWVAICERPIVFGEGEAEQASVFGSAKVAEAALRENLPTALRDIPLKIDIARSVFRPHTQGPSSGQNFRYDSGADRVRPLTTHELFKRLPMSQRICRIYAHSLDHTSPVAAALDKMIGHPIDDATNM